LFRRSLCLELTSWAYAAININSCLQALTEDISTPADIAPSALETIIFLLFYGLYKCTDLLLIIVKDTRKQEYLGYIESAEQSRTAEHFWLAAYSASKSENKPV